MWPETDAACSKDGVKRLLRQILPEVAHFLEEAAALRGVAGFVAGFLVQALIQLLQQLALFL